MHECPGGAHLLQAPPEKKRVRLGDLFESVSQLVNAEWPDSRDKLSHEVVPTVLDVYADRDLLEPVLLNLLRNAWQSALNVEEPAIVLRGRLNRRNNVVIDVVDNGPGVPDSIANKIFVPFFYDERRRLRCWTRVSAPGDNRSRRLHSLESKRCRWRDV
ncbi:MAG: hypothetical protein HQ492_12075 [Woeseiaceae bacterium]|nr:hypothetical protein [Woeseiaceae bacterium]